MGVEENKATVQMFYDEVLNRGNLDVIDKMTAENYVDHTAPPGMPPGREGEKQWFTMLRAAFPDGQTTIDDIIGEGDKVVVRATMTGTHQGDFMGIPAMGFYGAARSRGRGPRPPREVSVPPGSLRVCPRGEGEPRRDPPGAGVRSSAEPGQGAHPRCPREGAGIRTGRGRNGGSTRGPPRVPRRANPRLGLGGYVPHPSVRAPRGGFGRGPPRFRAGRLRRPPRRGDRHGPPPGGRWIPTPLHGLLALHEHDARHAVEADQPARRRRLRRAPAGEGTAGHAERDPAAHRARPPAPGQRRHPDGVPRRPCGDPRDP